jgi:hypothetical protein
MRFTTEMKDRGTRYVCLPTWMATSGVAPRLGPVVLAVDISVPQCQRMVKAITVARTPFSVFLWEISRASL